MINLHSFLLMYVILLTGYFDSNHNFATYTWKCLEYFENCEQEIWFFMPKISTYLMKVMWCDFSVLNYVFTSNSSCCYISYNIILHQSNVQQIVCLWVVCEAQSALKSQVAQLDFLNHIFLLWTLRNRSRRSSH